MHLLPRVRELEERFAEELVVIGVHAGKFSAERITRNLQMACLRLGVEHPVVNDRQFRIWKSYAVRAWPTVALIDAEGRLAGVQSGEFPVEPMAEAIAGIIARDRQRGTLRPGSVATEASGREAATKQAATAGTSAGSGPLLFPTRVIAEGERMWVSDAGHGRVLELGPGPHGFRVEDEWGGFVEPQGLARLGGATFVADRRGHSVARLAPGGDVTRVAGTGVLGNYRIETHDAPATSVDLRSPWGLAPLPNGDLAIAMAGSHQLWRLERDAQGTLGEGTLSLLAGTGGEDIGDGPAPAALLAQPTGLSPLGSTLAFADSESSAVRAVDMTDDRVDTIVGTGLFDFGDRDGEGDHVLLQHAQDLAWRGSDLVVADTYNDRLKVVQPASRRCQAHPGEAGSAGALWEPMGISGGADGSMLVADTNNHRIVRVTPDGAIDSIEIEE